MGCLQAIWRAEHWIFNSPSQSRFLNKTDCWTAYQNWLRAFITDIQQAKIQQMQFFLQRGCWKNPVAEFSHRSQRLRALLETKIASPTSMAKSPTSMATSMIKPDFHGEKQPKQQGGKERQHRRGELTQAAEIMEKRQESKKRTPKQGKWRQLQVWRRTAGLQSPTKLFQHLPQWWKWRTPCNALDLFTAVLRQPVSKAVWNWRDSDPFALWQAAGQAPVISNPL